MQVYNKKYECTNHRKKKTMQKTLKKQRNYDYKC